MLSKFYIAGLLDGEGCFLIKTIKGNRPNAKNITYTTRIQLNITFKKITELLKEQYGGSIYRIKRNNPKHRDTYLWVITSQKAKKLLMDVIPHLIIKRKEAKILLELQKHIETTKDWRTKTPGKRGHSKSVMKLREKLFQQLKELRRI